MRTAEAVAGMLCPVCKVGLMMSDRQGIEIDYCPQCRGIWLDRGELDKIIERSAEAAPAPMPTPAPASAPYPPQQQAPWQGGGYRGDDYRRDERHYHHKKRRSFLEDLFD
jgi:uncharacterized protein